MMESRRDKATIIDALEMVRAATDHVSLRKAVEEIDRMFLADKQEIIMSDQDWTVLNSAIAESPFLLEKQQQLTDTVQEGIYSGRVIGITDGIVMQRINREGKTVLHQVNRLSMSVKVNESVQIKYDSGVGQVTKELALGVER